MTHHPTDKTQEFVRKAIRARLSQEKIAAALGINHQTLRVHYKQEINLGKVDIPMLALSRVQEFLEYDAASAELRQKQAELAAKVLKSHGWAEKLEIEGNLSLPGITTEVVPRDENDK